jgi:hypothetical protein
MGKKRWTLPEQRTWLDALIPAFTQAQQNKTTLLFFENTYKKWEEKWPTAKPTDEEVQKTNGEAMRESAARQKATEQVCTLNFSLHCTYLDMSSG